MDSDLAVALAAARAGAAVVAEGFRRATTTAYKGSGNPVTEVDLASEQAVLEVLRRSRPADAVLAEEGGGAGFRAGRVWIVDPLDGTVNFVHRLPHVAVSVALAVDGRPAAGVVVDVVHGEVFAAARGAGTTLDGTPLRVSTVADPAKALVVTGFPYDRHLRADAYARVFGRVLARVEGVRRTGCAALDLCWVAAGRFDGEWEQGLAPWDTAAASLIAEEAGATVTDLAGGPYELDSRGVVASNGLVHTALLEAIAGGA
jgi:myo-inositol-1(or 4)-monophosphatase